MRQLVLLLLLGGAMVTLTAAAPAAAEGRGGPAEFGVPCDDDGLAHIPQLAEGGRRPYSVRKRSRTVHRDADDTPQLPPGRRRFDAVLPDEQGHDVASSTARTQRRLALHAANEVAGEPQESVAQPGLRRRPRRPAARRRNVSEEENDAQPDLDERDAKSDAVVDSYEKVRRYPTHLPAEDNDDDDDDIVVSNDVLEQVRDQVALEDVPAASREQRVDEDPDLPPGYRSKFPIRTFASDAGGAGDVLRVKPRKHVNQYQQAVEHQEAEHQEVEHHQAAEQQEVDHHQEAEQQRRPHPRPRAPSPLQRHHEQVHEHEQDISSSRGRQRLRASQRVARPDAAEPEQRHRPEQGAGDAADEVPPRRPLRRRPQPRPRTTTTPFPETDAVQQPEPAQPGPAPRRRSRPTSTAAPEPASEDAAVTEQDDALRENVVAAALLAEARAGGQPQRRPLRRRPRPRPTTPVAEEHDLDNAVPRTASNLQRRRRPAQGARPQTVSAESFPVQGAEAAPASRGHGRKLVSAAAVQDLPQVEVEHDGTAVEKKDPGHEPTLVRSAVKKVPAGGHGGDPSPALIQKIVQNTLKRLKPQIAEHEGDVGVDILVKIIQVEDR